MLYFLRMPTRSIFACDSETPINKLRKKYDPIFLPKLATVQNVDIKSFYSEFRHLYLKDYQYKPGDDLVSFINEKHDENIHFKRLPLIPDANEVEVAYPPDQLFKTDIELTVATQKALVIEGVYAGISAGDIIREVLDLFIKIRKEQHAGNDSSEQKKNMMKYLDKF
jgi:hypothetical protein